MMDGGGTFRGGVGNDDDRLAGTVDDEQNGGQLECDMVDPTQLKNSNNSSTKKSDSSDETKTKTAPGQQQQRPMKAGSLCRCHGSRFEACPRRGLSYTRTERCARRKWAETTRAPRRRRRSARRCASAGGSQGVGPHARVFARTPDDYLERGGVSPTSASAAGRRTKTQFLKSWSRAPRSRRRCILLLLPPPPARAAGAARGMVLLLLR